MNQCMRAWDAMKIAQSQQLLPPPPPPPPPTAQFAPEKRKPQDDLDDQMATRPPVWPAPAGHPLKPIGPVQPGNLAQSPNGLGGSSLPSPTVTVSRKRGRPSRADMEARTRQRASHASGYAPIAPVPGPTTASTEKPKKKGRRSAAERPLQPANLPRKILAPTGSEMRSNHEPSFPISPASGPGQPSEVPTPASMGPALLPLAQQASSSSEKSKKKGRQATEEKPLPPAALPISPAPASGQPSEASPSTSAGPAVLPIVQPAGSSSLKLAADAADGEKEIETVAMASSGSNEHLLATTT